MIFHLKYKNVSLCFALIFQFRRNFFERYRILDDAVAKPQKFSDCAKVFRDCEDAEKYNDVDDNDDDEDAIKDGQKHNNEEKHEEKDENTENSTDSLKKEEKPDETDEKEGAGDSPPKDIEDSNTIRRERTHKPIRNFILNRRISIV